MLPLSAEKIPATADELACALTRGLEGLELTPRGVEAVGDFPELSKLRLDLTGARLTRNMRRPASLAEKGSALRIAHLELTGEPIHFEQAEVVLRIEAERVTARLVGKAEEGSLVLEGAEAGTVLLRASRESLEALLHTVAAEAAARQGFEVKKTALSFTQEGPRAVSFRVEVTAKIFIMSAALALVGRLTIDDELNARLSGLDLDGDAMILKLAANQARPHLDRLEGRVWPLMAFSAGGLKLRDLELTAGPALEVRATLGGA